MKSFLKRLSKRLFSLVLCAVMVVGTFLGVGPVVSFEAEAANGTTIGDFTQTRVVGADGSYESLYRGYQKRFFLGEETNWPTDFIIPGLSSSNDYTPQGMTYWKAKEWILISAYHAEDSNPKPTVIYALDASTTDLVAVFKLKNVGGGSYNTTHGGGIAASEYNFYYADTASKISYVPLSEMDVPEGTVKDLVLRDSINLEKEMNGSGTAVKTSYCCYDEGVLWTGNFYYNNDQYGTKFLESYPSVLMGYRLAGNSSEEEWYYLRHGNNIVKLNSTTEQTASYTRSNTDSTVTQTLKYKTTDINGGNYEIRGTVDAIEARGEVAAEFAKVDLVKGKKYKIEYIASNNLSDMYLFAPVYTLSDGKTTKPHANVKQSSDTKITDLGDGRYHYQMIFTAGTAPAGADSTWDDYPNATYTGTYTIRFDQDSITAGTREFAFTDFSISEYVETTFTPDSKYEGIGCQGNPTYVILMDFDKIQYAMVDKGKLYISRSWNRDGTAGTHTRELAIADIDLTNPGNVDNVTVNGRKRPAHFISDGILRKFNGNNMLYMGEALCVIDDYLYMFAESAAWNYYGDGTTGGDGKGSCAEPIDVIWKIDQYAIQGLERPAEDIAAVEYQRVISLDEINTYDEYIIFYESTLKDPVTQKNILYLLDAYGGYGDTKLPKKNNAGEITQANTGDTLGMVGYKITDYSKEGNILVISEEDDLTGSIRWKFGSGYSNTVAGTQYSLELKSRELYYTKNPYFYMGDRLFAMTTTNSTGMKIAGWNNGEFVIYGSGYNLWCNDGSVAASITEYSKHYKNHGTSGYTPNYHNLDEVPGTFHANNTELPTTAASHQQGLQIYKRVSDPYASVRETNVYTDLQAKLQPDGTYNITLEAYATDAIQYQQTDEKRPTDFIFVIDSSGLMDGTDTLTYHYDTGWSGLIVSDLVSSGSFSTDEGNHGDAHSDSDPYYIQDTNNGNYYQVFVAYETAGSGCDSIHKFWAYYKDTVNNCYYHLKSDGNKTKCDSLAAVKQQTPSHQEDTSKYDDLKGDMLYKNVHYRKASKDSHKRIKVISQMVDQLTYKIAQDATKSGLDHRIAIATYGSGEKEVTSGTSWKNTKLYTPSATGGIQFNQITTDNYANAFFNVNQFGTVRTIAAGFSDGGHAIISNGLKMASNIVDAQINQKKISYDVNGTRSAAVIVISSGIPGYIDQTGFGNEGGVGTTISIADETLKNGAYDLKHNQAHVFSFVLGDGTDWDNKRLFDKSAFNEEDFMKYLSSNYTGAQSMAKPGPVNQREGADYFKRLPIGASFNLNNTTDEMLKIVTECSDIAISSLDTKAIVTEKLTDAFNLANATATVYKAKSKYDGVGRLYFADPVETSAYTADFNKTDRTITVTGFNYSDKNVSEANSKGENSKGEKLIVELSGVTADPSKTLTSAEINVQSDTALYAVDKNNKQTKLKQFQQYYFAIPEYTYYMDYGIPMLDKDVNGTLVSVDSLPQSQDKNGDGKMQDSEYSHSWSTDNMGIKFTEDKQDLIYTLNSQGALTVDDSRGYVLIQRDDGSYDWFRLNIVPASTVYYEENRLKSLGGNYTAWTQNGSPDDYTQSLSSKDDVFGQDSVYIGRTDKFSLDTNKKVTVSESKNRSQTETFTFTGTGFDLYSACGNNTGIQTVTVRNASTNELVKVYMVDTYYNDSTYNTLYQVPIVQFKTENLAAYKVEITAAYYSFAGGIKAQSTDTLEIEGTDIEATSAVADIPSTDELFRQIGMDELIGQEVEVIWMDENSIFNGGTGAGNMDITLQGDLDTSTNEKKLDNYIDGFRIYNTDTYDNEYIESEKNASYYSVIDAITKGNMGGDGENLVAYIEPGATGDLTFGNYLEKGGPKYEVYLAADQSIAFRFKATNENVRAMISIRAASGTAKAKINGKEFAVNNATETYFDITNYLDSKDADGCYIVTITNTGTGLLAVDNIKLTNAELSPLNGASIVTLNSLISMPSVEVDPFEKQPETFDFVQAPADNPFIDPEGSIPDIDEIGGTDGSTEEPVKNFFDIVVDFFRNVIERIKEVLQALPVFWTKAK